MIINSLLDNDLYSFTQQQAILHHFPNVKVEYKFKCRNNIDLTSYVDEINNQIDHLCTLKFEEYELDYLRSLYFIKSSYVDFLKYFKLDRKNIRVYVEGDTLNIRIKGNWFHTILYEVPILAIVNEVYFTSKGTDVEDTELVNRLNSKIALVGTESESRSEGDNLFRFADFGTRRRYSGKWQDEVVLTLKTCLPDNFIGTSNVYLAYKHKVTPIGTMAHQWVMAGQGFYNVRESLSQKYMLNKWVEEYMGDLGIALSDTLGFDVFLKDFDTYLSKLYDGCRHDSGDPFVWCDKLIAHYTKKKIDPRTKMAVFSDGLTFPLALKLFDTYNNRIKTSFGIGTNLTNDCGLEPLQIVIKLVSVNNHPVAKISDSQGKGMCEDEEYLAHLKTIVKIRRY